MSLLKPPLHLGEVLKELYLEPMGMGAIALAHRLGGTPHADRAAGQGHHELGA